MKEIDLFHVISSDVVISGPKVSVSNKHKFQRAFWAHALKFLRALTNVCGPKGNNLHLKAYKNIFDKQCINVYAEFLRAFRAHALTFQRALLNFQGLRVRGPFLFETLPKVTIYAIKLTS